MGVNGFLSLLCSLQVSFLKIRVSLMVWMRNMMST